ncbi:hypothetical protein NECAME_12797 [Necator americanus]|uniref:Uncharacterized protein n=1 Tax=Necator americanus TaxID=51031 RepID=W2SYQ4_NECAM|nr:hypothetical protein NECAME_12797 [Necator americanus]ETN74708.1 hypothetical protein NECAME_12797 [Necator americanus]
MNNPYIDPYKVNNEVASNHFYAEEKIYSQNWMTRNHRHGPLRDVVTTILLKYRTFGRVPVLLTIRRQLLDPLNDQFEALLYCVLP